MATKTVSFRISGESLINLQSRQRQGESLSQTAKRIFERTLRERAIAPEPNLETTLQDIQSRISYLESKLGTRSQRLSSEDLKLLRELAAKY